MRTLALLFTTLTAWSHDMWIEPATFAPQPGSIVAVKLRVGQDLIGDPIPRSAALIREQVTPQRVAQYFAHYLKGHVTRWELPGIHAFNFLLTNVLGGGGIASLRYDPQGKAYAQMLLCLPIVVPAEWTDPDGILRAPNAGQLSSHTPP